MIVLHAKKGLFSFINDIPINTKFLLIYIFCVFVPIVAINLIFWNKISNDIKGRERDNYNISMQRVENDISAMFEGCVDISHSVSSDKVLYEKMETHYSNASEYYADYYELFRDRINRYLPIYNNISNITLYTTNDTIDSGGNYYYINQQVKDSQWYKDISKNGSKISIYTYYSKTNDYGNKYKQDLSVIRQLDEFSSGTDKYKQLLKIDINMDKLYGVFERESNYLYLLLVDPKGHIICSTDRKFENDLSKGYANVSSFKADSDTLEAKLGTAGYLNGWSVIAIPNHNRMSSELTGSNLYILAITLILMIFSTVLTYIIVRSYNYRLKKLHKHIIGVENHKFELINIVEGKDEIGELINSFNIMTTEINTLINDVYKLQFKKKDLEIQRVQAELRYLQSQIDPHFLFNTLNAVMAVCVKNNYAELTEIIKYLSKIFRRLISWKDDLVTIQEEISFTEMYLKIEKFRFLDNFDYELKVEESTLSMKVPKMSIQTLVENACKHGIQNSAGVGVVKINVSQKEEFLCVDVEDNGIGIEENKLQEIIEALPEEDDYCDNIGIRNVYKRLHLYYGDEIEFYIKSGINNGTIVHYGINLNVINNFKCCDGKLN